MIDPNLSPRLRDVPAEEAVLGALRPFEDGAAAIDAAMSILDPGDFTSRPREALFRALVEMRRRGDLCGGTDLVSVANEIVRRREENIVANDSVALALELARLAERVASGASVEEHARIVRDLADRRRGIEACARAASQFADLSVSLDGIRVELPRITLSTRSGIRKYEPFPIDAFPEPLQGFVLSSASAIGCDPALVALPLLAGLAASIGMSRVALVKPGWNEAPILWSVVVAESGEHKTPAMEVALGPLRRRQVEWLREHEAAVEAHRADRLRFEAALRDWQKHPEGDPPTQPTEPIARRLLASNTTVEALAPLLRGNPRGLLLCRDELSGWIRSFGAYKGGRGDDVEQWLELHRAGHLLVDRKSGDRATISVDAASCSVCGTIQPGTLRRVLDAEYRENGLAARLLLSMPPARPRRWSDETVDPQLAARMDQVYGRLLDLEATDGRPIEVGMTPAAFAAWTAFYDAHGAQLDARTGDLRAAWSKLESYCLRLALIFHLCRVVADDPDAGPEIDATDIAAAKRLVEWFGLEAERVYAVLGETSAESDTRKLVELIRRDGGEITARDLQKRSSRFKSADDAERALERLVRAGYGIWVEVPTSEKGGRPTRAFRLHDDDSDADTTDKTPVKGGPPGVLSVSSTPTLDNSDRDEPDVADEEKLPWE